MAEAAFTTLVRLFGDKVRFTFSANCCSGIVWCLGKEAVCECWRFREARGEPHDAETERIAGLLSQVAQDEFRRQVLRTVVRP